MNEYIPDNISIEKYIYNTLGIFGFMLEEEYFRYSLETGCYVILSKVKDASIWVKTFEDKKISLNFTYDDIQYKYMSISQIDLLNYYKNKTDDSYPLGTVTVVFSLTDKYYWNGKYYKVVAQILY